MPDRDPYLEFLRSKIPQAEVVGFDPPSGPHPSLFPHQVDIARWAIRMGRRALGTELNLEYWKDSIAYMEMAEREIDAPTLFDLAGAGLAKIEAA